jgi:hypothetical protein
MARLTLDNDETNILRSLILEIKEITREKKYSMERALTWHNVETENSPYLAIYNKEIELLDKVQGLLLRKDSSIIVSGDFE